MKETIASRCLAVAKQNEEKRSQKIKDRILNDIIRPLLTNCLQELRPFPEDEAVELPFDDSFTLRKILGASSEEDVEQLFESLGFRLSQLAYS